MARKSVRLLIAIGGVMLFYMVSGPSGAYSQSPSWPEISKEDLALKDNPAEPGDSAMILFREETDDDQKGVGTAVLCIKIFNEKGKQYADIEIPYIPKVWEIEDIRARVLQPDGRVEDFAGQIYDKTSVKYKKRKVQVKAFTFPNVQAGTVVEYAYTTHWKAKEPDYMKHPSDYIISSVWSIPSMDWDVQSDLFTRRARLLFHPMSGGFAIWNCISLPDSTIPQKQANGDWLLEVQDLSAYHEEEFMPPENMVRGKVRFYYYVGGSPNSDSYWYAYSKGTREAFDKFLDKRKAMENAVRAIVSTGDPDLIKIQKIYARVQQVRFLELEPGKTEKEEKKDNLRENKNVEDVLKHNYARLNEANLLFVGLARAAGFEASPVMVTSRATAVFDRSYLNSGQLNAMVAEVHVGTTAMYLDPASPFCPFGMLPWYETAASGIRFAATGQLFITLPAPDTEQAIINRKIEVQMEKDGSLEGSIQVYFSGQEALYRRVQASQMDDAGRRKDLEDGIKALLPSGATVTLDSAPDWTGSSFAMGATFKIKVPSVGTQAGHRRVLSGALCQSSLEYPFVGSKRTNSIYFAYPSQVIDHVSMKLPAGYEVENIPEGRKLNAVFGSFATSYNKKAAQVEFDRQLVISGFYFKPNYFYSLRAFYKTVRDGDEDQIVLKTQDATAKN